jgi:hypothetical protein
MSDEKDEKVLMGYCMKCKEKTAMNDTVRADMKNGRPAMKGVCSAAGCGTNMYKILSKDDVAMLEG